jgi:hypothetical protein
MTSGESVPYPPWLEEWAKNDPDGREFLKMLDEESDDDDDLPDEESQKKLTDEEKRKLVEEWKKHDCRFR